MEKLPSPHIHGRFSLSFERPNISTENDQLHISPHRITFLLCTQGRKTIQLNFTEHILEPRSLVVFYPGIIWKTLDTSDDFQARFLSITFPSTDQNSFFDLNTVFSLSSYIIGHPHNVFSQAEMETIETYLNLIQNRYEAHVDDAIIFSLLSTFFLELNQTFTDRKEHKSIKISRKEEILWKFLSLLREHYKESRSVAFYADKLYISPKHLSSVIKQLSNKTAHDLITYFVIMKAKQLLKTTTLSIQEISDELHFANQSFFGKFFKQNTGQSPSAYRGK